jgi:hypothetical protein
LQYHIGFKEAKKPFTPDILLARQGMSAPLSGKTPLPKTNPATASHNPDPCR